LKGRALLRTPRSRRKSQIRAEEGVEKTLCNASPGGYRTAPQTKPSPTMADLLNNQDIKEWLKKLPEWDLEKKHIERLFEFDDFTLAMDFVNSVAEIAEEDDHHPNIDIRYNKVRIELSTHSEGGLTDLDFEVAEEIDTLVEE